MRSVSVRALVCQGEGGGEELFAPAAQTGADTKELSVLSGAER